MFGIQKYNYSTFNKDLVMRDAVQGRMRGPKAGELAPDFSAPTLDGGEISLSDYEGKSNVVLTFGSATCPFTASSIGGMNQLFEDYTDQDVQFLFVYTREAHPGERLPSHRTLDDKSYAADLFRRAEGVEMPILVDDLKGRIHRKYGKLPNATYIIDKSGRVAFRSLWTRSSVVQEALQELLERQQERDVEHAVVHGGEYDYMPVGDALWHVHRALNRGGRKARLDFAREMGFAGRVAMTAGRIRQPFASHPTRFASGFALSAVVLTGSILLGRHLRDRRSRPHGAYDFSGLDATRRRIPPLGNDEAVGM